jgi:hypothetical protein
VWEFYALFNGYQRRIRLSDMRTSYYLTWHVMMQADPKSFDFNRVYNEIYDGLHPETANRTAEEKQEFLDTFNL